MKTVSFELAQKLASIGFDEYTQNAKAPSYAKVLAWFRERDIDIMIDRSFSMTKSYHYVIVVDGDFENLIQQDSVPNRDYYDAAHDAINYIIDNNLLKKK